MVGSFVRLGYVRYLQGRYDDAIEQYERERAWLSQHDHALKERALLEIGQKTERRATGAKATRSRATQAFEETLRAFRARQARGAADPFTSYYMAAMYALRGRERRGHAVPRRSRRPTAGADPRAGVQRDPDFDPHSRLPVAAGLARSPDSTRSEPWPA